MIDCFVRLTVSQLFYNCTKWLMQEHIVLIMNSVDLATHHSVIFSTCYIYNTNYNTVESAIYHEVKCMSISSALTAWFNA